MDFINYKFKYGKLENNKVGAVERHDIVVQREIKVYMYT